MLQGTACQPHAEAAGACRLVQACPVEMGPAERGLYDAAASAGAEEGSGEDEEGSGEDGEGGDDSAADDGEAAWEAGDASAGGVPAGGAPGPDAHAAMPHMELLERLLRLRRMCNHWALAGGAERDAGGPEPGPGPGQAREALGTCGACGAGQRRCAALACGHLLCEACAAAQARARGAQSHACMRAPRWPSRGAAGSC